MLRPISSERPSLTQILGCAWLHPIAHELPQQAPSTPNGKSAPTTPKEADPAPGMFGKWCEEITICPMEVEAAASGGGGGGGGGGRSGSGGGESSKRPVEHACPAAEAAEQAAKRVRGAGDSGRSEAEEPEGVNGMLVRSLGWVQLETEKEKMVGDVASALDSLGVRYEVVKGELSDVVWVGDDAEALSGDAHASGAVAADAGLGEGVPRRTTAGGTPITEGKLCVRMRIQPGEGATSSLDISRHAGDVLQFHSFYRDVRNQLAGVNGWVKDHESGSYQHVVGVPRRATAP